MKIQKSLKALVAIALVAGASSCTVKKTPTENSTSSQTMEEPVAQKKYAPGIDFDAMDTSVSPKEDFYRYVNGTWIDSTEIPADQTVWGGFNKLRKDTDADVLAILNKSMNDDNLDPMSDQAKAVYVYQSIMDTDGRDRTGFKPLEPYFNMIDEVESIDNLPALLGELSAYGVSGLVSFSVGPDAKDTNMNVAQTGPGSLGMSREYYVEDDADSKQKLAKYQEHIARMLAMTGTDNEQADQTAAAIVGFETKLAQPMLDKVAVGRIFHTILLAVLFELTFITGSAAIHLHIKFYTRRSSDLV